jgi:PAS domain S-box-containing protein
VEGIILAVFTGILMFLIHHAFTRRIRWLAEEAARLNRGEAPREALAGKDSVAGLSVAMRRMATRIGDLRRAIDEHAIVAFTDRQGRITFVNDKFCDISGYSRGELVGKTHKIINSGRHPEAFFREMWKTIGSGKVWHGEIENRAKGGSPYFVETTIVPCPGPDGKPQEYIAIRTDVTGQRVTADHLRRLSQELEAKNSDLEAVIHAASHDLRTPLVNVQGFASVVGDQTETVKKLLQDAAEGRLPAGETVESVTGEMTDAVRFICAGAEKMDALLKGLLIFSRMGRMSPVLQPVDANNIVKETLAAIRFQIRESGAEVTAGTLPVCLADPGLLGQVFSNLIDNAVKYRSPERPLRLAISGTLEGDRCVFRFTDNGIGIAPEHRETVFELFHRLDPRRSDGHGLGLSIVRRALDRMGGTVSVEAAPGGGSAFVLSMAQAGSDAPPAGKVQP